MTWQIKLVFIVVFIIGIYVSCVPPEEEIKWCKLRGTKWPRDRAASADRYPWELSIQEVPNCSVKMCRRFLLVAGIACY